MAGGPGFVLLARSCAGRFGLYVFALDGLFAPEQGVFIRFREGQRQHFIAAFFPNFSASFSSYLANSKIASAISGEVFRKLAHSPTRWAFAS
jgi:hypothetical protein